MTGVEVYQQRIAKVREKLVEHNTDALVLRNLEEKKAGITIRYLTGFTGSHAVCAVTQARLIFITDGRYELQSQEQVQGWEIFVKFPSKFFEILGDVVSDRVGVIGEEISAEYERDLKRELKLAPRALKLLPNIVKQVRAVKDEGEVEKIRASIAAIETALEGVMAAVQPGMTECTVARMLEDARPKGSILAFPSIIASGARSALIHGVPDLKKDKVIEQGDIVQFDVGFEVDGYTSDISRVAVIGRATEEQRKMHRAILDAIEQALELYRPGVSCREAHERASAVLESCGFPKLPHGLGHGMGMDVHELPTVKLASKDVFEGGNVVTIEPGIYEKGKGGMRIEDDILITDAGPERLTQFPTELREL